MIDAVEPLGELDVAGLLPQGGVHHETHRLLQRLAVVEVMVTVHVQEVGSVGQDGGHPDLNEPSKR
ncbi:unnamed protein product [Spirodela intermedia]|uniref:Uncharacterized protein n=2 Tax=Spirodela intermedia TaxID=51605 RepID=A0A7I8L076_SPIIN|nr:unnamed protein product [Spirodela intermedia]CAA6666379.1 unnamed protein product [Spirodela intermedia]CAA7403162.1 unnamed protein product [Spirodela intermedia]